MEYTAHFTLCRRPLLAREVLDRFHELTSQDPSCTEAELLRIFSDPLLMQALELASVQVHALTTDLLDGKTVSGKQKLLQTLYKYLIRLCTRCTPYGLFAGYFQAETAGSTRFDFLKTDFIKKQSRLDAASLSMIKERILAIPSVQEQLLFYPNTSLYKAADCYRYMKRQLSEQQTEFVLSQAPAGAALEAVLKASEHGLYPKQIKDILQTQQLSKKAAARFFNALISEQILVSTLEINLTGQEYLERLKETLQNLKGTKVVTAKLSRIGQGLRQGLAPEEINRALLPVLGKQPFEPALQTHMRIQTKSSQISHRVLNEIHSSISKIASLCTHPQNPDLDTFAKDFFARYGQQKIPVLLALDYDYGVGYGKLNAQSQHNLPLLDGLSAFSNDEQKTNKPMASPLAEALYMASVAAGDKGPVKISTQLLEKQMPGHKASLLPDCFYVLGSFHTASANALDQGDYLFDLKALGGPSASNLLTRFCQGDAALTSKVQSLIESEESLSEQIIFAEIAHFPDHKAANILQRPALRAYELVYLARGAEKSQPIHLDDVLISCQDGKNITLHSSKLQKRIMPVLSSAHNFSSGLPTYRFLCELASAGSQNLHWNWGQYQDQPFLPRICFEKLVISKASWKLGPTELAELDGLKQHQKTAGCAASAKHSRKNAWDQIKKRLNLPRFFTAGHSDHMLLIDSCHDMALELLCNMLKKQGSLRISEYLDKPGQGLFKMNHTHFSNEIIIPFTRTAPVEKTRSNIGSPMTPPGQHIIRSFPLTSPWLYVKIYGAERLADSLLTNFVGPLCEDLEKKRVIQKWFFIRYKDPDPHIRLRFYSKNEGFWVQVLKALHQVTAPLVENGTIVKMQTESYQREIERYPAGLYEKIESVFHVDSKVVWQSLKIMQNACDENLRWLFAMQGADRLLTDFGLDLKMKAALIEKLHGQFAAELDSGGHRRKVMDQNYRSRKEQISRYMQSQHIQNTSPLSGQLERRSIQIAKILSLNPLQEKQHFLAVVPDLLHLFLNRCFHGEQRSQEYVIYHYLKKYYCTILKNTQSEKIFL